MDGHLCRRRFQLRILHTWDEVTPDTDQRSREPSDVKLLVRFTSPQNFTSVDWKTLDHALLACAQLRRATFGQYEVDHLHQWIPMNDEFRLYLVERLPASFVAGKLEFARPSWDWSNAEWRLTS